MNFNHGGPPWDIRDCSRFAKIYFECPDPFCEFKSQNEMAFQEHMCYNHEVIMDSASNENVEKPNFIPCQKCTQKFNSIANLASHMEKIHTSSENVLK